MAKIKTIRVKVEWFNASREQYKPYSYNMVPTELYVELPLDDSHVIEQKDGVTVIDMDGFSAMLATVSTSLGNMHDAWLESCRPVYKTKIN